ncbi:MAG: alpha/beta fold hydrolase [Flavobacteriales bacterium]
MGVFQQFRKSFVKLASTVLPNKIAGLAYDSLTLPKVRKIRPHEKTMLNKALKETIKFRHFDIQTYKWGNIANEKILLIHGWEGQAGNFTDIIEELLNHNYYVIAFDGPSHGFSSTGKTNLFDFSDVVLKMIREHDPKKLISHSFGGVATTYALSRNKDINIEKYVLLTTPDKFSERIDDIVQSVGITNKVKSILIKNIEKEIKFNVNDANVSEFVKEVNVNKALIIHDKNDQVISIEQSINVNNHWPACSIKEIEGTGHFRILRTKSVNQLILNFLN